MSPGFEILAERVPWSPSIQLAALERREARSGFSTAAAQPLVMQRVEEGDSIQPFVTLSSSEAQGLMDELWRCGIRPTNGAGSVGQLAATEKHLEDMRRLVFDGGAK